MLCFSLRDSDGRRDSNSSDMSRHSNASGRLSPSSAARHAGLRPTRGRGGDVPVRPRSFYDNVTPPSDGSMGADRHLSHSTSHLGAKDGGQRGRAFGEDLSNRNGSFDSGRGGQRLTASAQPIRDARLSRSSLDSNASESSKPPTGLEFTPRRAKNFFSRSQEEREPDDVWKRRPRSQVIESTSHLPWVKPESQSSVSQLPWVKSDSMSSVGSYDQSTAPGRIDMAKVSPMPQYDSPQYPQYSPHSSQYSSQEQYSPYEQQQYPQQTFSPAGYSPFPGQLDMRRLPQSSPGAPPPAPWSPPYGQSPATVGQYDQHTAPGRINMSQVRQSQGLYDPGPPPPQEPDTRSFNTKPKPFLAHTLSFDSTKVIPPSSRPQMPLLESQDEKGKASIVTSVTMPTSQVVSMATDGSVAMATASTAKSSIAPAVALSRVVPPAQQTTVQHSPLAKVDKETSQSHKSVPSFTQSTSNEKKCNETVLAKLTPVTSPAVSSSVPLSEKLSLLTSSSVSSTSSMMPSAAIPPAGSVKSSIPVEASSVSKTIPNSVSITSTSIKPVMSSVSAMPVTSISATTVTSSVSAVTSAVTTTSVTSSVTITPATKQTPKPDNQVSTFEIEPVKVSASPVSKSPPLNHQLESPVKDISDSPNPPRESWEASELHLKTSPSSSASSSPKDYSKPLVIDTSTEEELYLSTEELMGDQDNEGLIKIAEDDALQEALEFVRQKGAELQAEVIQHQESENVEESNKEAHEVKHNEQSENSDIFEEFSETTKPTITEPVFATPVITSADVVTTMSISTVSVSRPQDVIKPVIAEPITNEVNIVPVSPTLKSPNDLDLDQENLDLDKAMKKLDQVVNELNLDSAMQTLDEAVQDLDNKREELRDDNKREELHDNLAPPAQSQSSSSRTSETREDVMNLQPSSSDKVTSSTTSSQTPPPPALDLNNRTIAQVTNPRHNPAKDRCENQLDFEAARQRRAEMERRRHLLKQDSFNRDSSSPEFDGPMPLPRDSVILRSKYGAMKRRESSSSSSSSEESASPQTPPRSPRQEASPRHSPRVSPMALRKIKAKMSHSSSSSFSFEHGATHLGVPGVR